jgi:hypothetical protein
MRIIVPQENFKNIKQFNIIENNLINCLGTRGGELDGKKKWGV